MKNVFEYRPLLHLICLMVFLVACGDSTKNAATNPATDSQTDSQEATSGDNQGEGRRAITLQDEPTDPKRSYEMYIAHQAASKGPPTVDTQYTPVLEFVTGEEFDALKKNNEYLEGRTGPKSFTVKADLPEVREYYDESDSNDDPKTGDEFTFTVCIAESYALIWEATGKQFDAGAQGLESIITMVFEDGRWKVSKTEKLGNWAVKDGQWEAREFVKGRLGSERCDKIVRAYSN